VKGSERAFGTDQPRRSAGSAARIRRRLSRYWELTLDEVALAQRLDDAVLVAGAFEVEVQPHAGLREVVEALVERQALAAAQIAVVVGEAQRAVAVQPPLGQHVELDHVDAGGDRGVEGLERVAGRDLLGALVADAHERHRARHLWHPGHQ
jgi:hypothetical protein